MRVIFAVVVYKLIVQHQSKAKIALMMTWPMASVVSVPPNNLDTHDTVVPSPEEDSINFMARTVHVRVSIHRTIAPYK